MFPNLSVAGVRCAAIVVVLGACTEAHVQRSMDANALDAGVVDASARHDTGPAVDAATEIECQGPLDTCETETRDGLGRLVSSTTDYGCDETNDSCSSASFDDQDRQLTEAWDYDCDGRPERVRTWQYFDDGYEVSDRSGSDDGTLYCASQRYEGNRQVYTWDDGCDGERVTCAAYYSSDDRTLSRYSACDGTPVSPFCVRTTFDESGRVLTLADDSGCDGVLDSQCLTIEYDTSGHQLSSIRDADCDGVPDGSCEYTTFDEGGRMLSYEFSDCVNATTKRCYVNVFNGDEPAGAIARVEDSNCDGVGDGPRTCLTYVRP